MVLAVRVVSGADCRCRRARVSLDQVDQGPDLINANAEIEIPDGNVDWIAFPRRRRWKRMS